MKAGPTQKGDDFEGILSDAERAYVINLVRRQSQQRLARLKPPARVRHCLQTGEPEVCDLQYQHNGERRTTSVRVRRTAANGLSIDAPDLPADLQLWSVVILKSIDSPEFTPFQEKFPARVLIARSSDSLNTDSREFSTALSATSGEEGDETDEEQQRKPSYQIDARWDERAKAGLKTLTVTLTTDGQLADQIYAVAELRISGKVEAVQARAICLTRYSFGGRWDGAIEFPRSQELLHHSVTLVVRPFTSSDIDLLDNDDSDGLSDVTRLLAQEQLDALPLKSVGDTYESAPLSPASVNDDVVIALSITPRKEDVDEQSAPFEQPGAVALNGGGLSRGDALDSESLEAASREDNLKGLSFDGVWRKVEAPLKRWISRRIYNPDDREDCVQEIAMELARKGKSNGSGQPFNVDDSSPWGWLKTVTENSVKSYWRKAKKRRQMTREIDGEIAAEESHGPWAVRTLREIRHRIESILTPLEREYIKVVVPEDLDTGRFDDVVEKRGEVLASTVDTPKPTLDAIASLLGLSDRDNVRNLEDVVYNKIHIFRAVQDLGARLSPDERRYVECRAYELPRLIEDQPHLPLRGWRQRAEWIQNRLTLEESVFARVQESAERKLELALALGRLLDGGHCTTHDGDSLKSLYLDSAADVDLKRRFGVNQPIRQKLATKLHAAILLDRDDRQRGPLFDAGRKFVQTVCIEGQNVESLLQLPRSSVATRQGSLLDTVRRIWCSTQTIVPPTHAPWIWDGLDLSAEEHRERA